ncbi:DNA-binding protein [Mesorhizobium sp. M1A.F.Ca.ET.072.01.1.1]|uniref:helix-turn-helix transcriptional regulator n=1 Tax=Mesorhizobium sp. M1A.F.Ca.ET.072.01.1.1 TaxID=2496753 RepID=UPI000FD49022|nr:helix-turn-helix domain-containing protein [Mesorhizobium sp. M1A.F.Ca.ET.072.01.1.1]RUW55646.1 DNA-binding protein [Mesorhizobium sp. M1A.F.Ca.ET.072.01.1.1]
MKILRKSAAGRMAKTLKLVDVADYIGVTVRTLYNMIDDGRFPVPPIPDTKPRRWNVEDIDAWRKPSSNQANA